MQEQETSRGSAQSAIRPTVRAHIEVRVQVGDRAVVVKADPQIVAVPTDGVVRVPDAGAMRNAGIMTMSAAIDALMTGQEVR
ncbi:hypothetical protein L332_03365 [Agrococcus pavilionensis RW1]|uniref:Uncharacterized protein n=1 Tax=Agrococcus pavilionensis RW1 TaxID=1330458 RepID=U1LMD7_9MICO|nr:hypothetical protein [Agrococcus pavilionensis]ERG63494.1 hypothetical protein L332_03365 [Agrococcus pavilionensis RW1]